MTPCEQTTPLSLRRDFQGWRWGTINLGWILAAHGGLISTFAICYAVLPLVAYLPLALLVSLLHQKTMSEWIHEAAHFNLLPNRSVNDIVATGLCGVFLANSVASYRVGHMRHHTKSSFFETDDPDTNFSLVRNRRELWVGIAADLSGVSAIRGYLRLYVLPRFRNAKNHIKQVSATIGLLLFLATSHIGAIAFLFSIGRIDAYIVYYASTLTLYPLFNRIRACGQHVEICDDGRPRFLGSNISRTIDAGILDRIFFTSRIMMYHHEHHAWPTLTFRACRSLAERSVQIHHADLNSHCFSRLFLMKTILAGLPADDD